MPPTSQSQALAGQRVAAGRLVRPSTAPPSYPKPTNPFPLQLPYKTTGPSDKMYDTLPDGARITFPRGDIGAQQFGRSEPRRDGGLWIKNPATQSAREIGSAPHCSTRAFITPHSPFIIYQMKT